MIWSVAAQRPAYPELTLRSRAAWRRWLQQHHAEHRGVWFVHLRKESGQDTLSYGHYIDWLANAKRDETRARRLAEAIWLLEQGRKLALK